MLIKLYLIVIAVLMQNLDNEHTNMLSVRFTKVASWLGSYNTIYNGQHALQISNVDLHFPSARLQMVADHFQ